LQEMPKEFVEQRLPGGSRTSHAHAVEADV